MYERYTSRLRTARWPLALSLGCLLVIALLAGCGSSGATSSSPLAAASVDGNTLSLSDYQQMVATFKATNELNAQSNSQGGSVNQDWQSPAGRAGLAQAQTKALNFLIDLQVARDELAQNNLSASSSVIASDEKSIRSQLQSAEQQAPTVTGLRDITARAIHLLAEEDADQKALMGSSKIMIPSAHIRVIILKSAAQAQTLEKQAQGGADFGALAKANSLDTNTGAQGGAIGVVYLGQIGAQNAQLGSDFDKAVFLAAHPSTYAIIPDNGAYVLVEATQRAEQPISAIQDQQAKQSIIATWLREVARPQAKIQKYVAIG